MPAGHPLLSKLARTLVLSEAEAEAVRAIPVESVAFKADQMISREGDKHSRSCLVMEGVACTSKVVAGGKRQIMALHIRGDGPDLHTLLLKHLDSDIWAVSDCRLAFMTHKDLRTLNREHPRLGEDLWRTTLVEGAIYREWMVNVGQRQADSRMAHLCCEILLRSEEAGLGQDGTCPFPVTQADLSEMTAMSPVHVNRTLQALREQGLISFGKGRLTIHNWPALVTLADFRADYLHLPTAKAA
ncbi:Crp/Fnr family transcriptional regulator [Rubellimicrobium rubrum]|uniref:Crp/Fnr family transcriptional regulator n=1 Tax=Rubellimicrobium rubrum TaxID=2585369 RepID=A0A5C4MT87_9RHOB|nr:Crp/Fnr family transcriptional regulator [Rubellimicrobium rubrum]TNC48555.1 Crp/Fnr family transcriptional regulator [Rubellimicrobium rubrum]